MRPGQGRERSERPGIHEQAVAEIEDVAGGHAKGAVAQK